MGPVRSIPAKGAMEKKRRKKRNILSDLCISPGKAAQYSIESLRYVRDFAAESGLDYLSRYIS